MKRFILINLFFLSNIAGFIQAAETGERQKKQGVLSGITGIFKKEKKEAPNDIINKIHALNKELTSLKELKKLNEIAFKNASEKLKSEKLNAKQQYFVEETKKTTRNHLKSLNKRIREIEKELENYERKYILPGGLQEELDEAKKGNA